MYHPYFNDKWVDSNRYPQIRNTIIREYETFTLGVVQKYKKPNNQPLFKFQFSKYRVFISNENIPVTPKTTNEKKMFQILQYGDSNSIEVRNVYENIRYTYKIHFQPKDDKVLEVVGKILNTIANDNILINYISEMKFMTFMALKEAGPELPRIVVYIRSLVGLSGEQVQDTVGYILNRFIEAFNGWEQFGTGETPRYNHKINNLIYYAQGHGRLKEYLVDSGDERLEGLLDGSSDNAHFNCSQIGYPDEDCHVHL